ncbi:MAG TPA: hypothetical protein VKY90_19230 [Candidatus Dormibacteraeota bacterium]|nr:hypothetical protein [Candidatus Dormibacteraeota bacterium]
MAGRPPMDGMEKGLEGVALGGAIAGAALPAAPGDGGPGSGEETGGVGGVPPSSGPREADGTVLAGLARAGGDGGGAGQGRRGGGADAAISELGEPAGGRRRRGAGW